MPLPLERGRGQWVETLPTVLCPVQSDRADFSVNSLIA